MSLTPGIPVRHKKWKLWSGKVEAPHAKNSINRVWCLTDIGHEDWKDRVLWDERDLYTP